MTSFTGTGISSQPSSGVWALSAPREQHWLILATTGEAGSGSWAELREMRVMMMEEGRVVESIVFTPHHHLHCTVRY